MLVRRHHPDGAIDLADAGRRTVVTAEITEAYAELLSARDRRPGRPADPSPPRPKTTRPPTTARPGPPGAGSRPHTPRATPRDLAEGTRRVLLDAPLADAFNALLEVAHLVGDVSYVDRLSGVLEVIITDAPSEATSLLIYLESPQAAVTEAMLGVEPLGVHPPAPLDPLVDRIDILLATQRPPIPD